eukprot:gene21852-28882_t
MTFKVVKIGAVPSGWRMATVDEFLSNKREITPLISEWGIIACKDGKADGSGYGGKGTKGCGHDGIGEMLLTNDGGGGGGGAAAPRAAPAAAPAPSSGLSRFKRINYLDDIPDGFRLLSCNEFEEHRNDCLRQMEEWTICLLSDGKCDGRGYGAVATRLSRVQREESSKTNERMGEMLVGYDSGGLGLQAFASDVEQRYATYASNMDCNSIVNTFLQFTGMKCYKPFVLVSSCPGDSHGGMHTRVDTFTQRQGWRFAPVQFKDRAQAADWKRLWKLQVEEFACCTIADGKVDILEVKIDGGGAGCAVERSKNMSQWWVDWIKRLGADVFDDLNGNGNARSSVCPSGAVSLQIGQVVVTEEDFTNFTSAEGTKMHPIKTNGIDFELHTLVLHGGKRNWVLITDVFKLSGGQWARDKSNMVAISGTY